MFAMNSKILEEMRASVDINIGTLAFVPDKRYDGIEFSAQNYHDISPVPKIDTVYVDGGIAEIIMTPGLALAYIRNAAVVYGITVKTHTREFFVSSKMSENHVSGKIDGRDEIILKNTTIQGFFDTIRKCTELEYALEIANNLEGKKMIVLDGTLQPMNDMETRKFNSLFNIDNCIVGAVAKTTHIMTTTGQPYPSMLMQRSNKMRWYYYPAISNNNSNHNAHIVWAKLHARSNHVFRCEIRGEEFDTFFGNLVKCSNDLLFPGYPYGLIRADRLARVSEKEASYFKSKVLASLGKSRTNIEKLEFATNAHEILDNM